MKKNSHRAKGRNAFVLGAIGVFIGAIVHVVGLIGGPDWIAFLGAPTWAVESARNGTWIAPVGTLAIAGLLCFWSAYALSGAHILRKLPFLKPILGITAFILIARGVIFLPLLPKWDWSMPLNAFHGFLSFYILGLGVLYAYGFYGLLKEKQI